MNRSPPGSPLEVKSVSNKFFATMGQERCGLLDDVVAAAMGPNLGGIRSPLAQEAIAGDVVLGEKVQDRCVVVVSLVHGRPQISLQNPRIVPKSTVQARESARDPRDGPHVDRHVGKGSSRDISTAQASRELDVSTRYALWRYDQSAVVRHIVAVPTETVGAVEDR